MDDKFAAAAAAAAASACSTCTGMFVEALHFDHMAGLNLDKVYHQVD